MQSYPNYLNQGYPSYQTPTSRPVIMPTGLKGRPVASLDEVRGTSIDFDGSVFYFPDLGNKRIYTKQINMDGTSSINVYELTQLPIETNGNYITRQEFEQSMQQIRSMLTPMQPIAEMPQQPEAPVNIAAQF